MTKRILDVPKIKQLPGGYCAIASLTMVLGYYGYEIEQKEVANSFPSPERIMDEGIFWNEVPLAAKNLGFKAEEHHNLTLTDIINFIDQDIPIIARGKSHINPRYRHSRVIRGYETDFPSFIYVNDPDYLRRNKFSYDEFRKLWLIKGNEGTKNYGVVIKRRCVPTLSLNGI